MQPLLIRCWGGCADFKFGISPRIRGIETEMRKSYCLLLAVAVLLSGCVSAGGVKPDADAESLTICSEPRPQMCTMDYRPVCGALKDGSFKTFSNGCMACAAVEVVGYRNGECAEGQ
jgi:hypothetical protein